MPLSANPPSRTPSGWLPYLVRAGFYGAGAWSAYALVEQFFLSLPSLTHRGSLPFVWPSLAALGVFVAIGVASGMIGATVLRLAAGRWSASGVSDDALRTIGTLTVVMGFAYCVYVNGEMRGYGSALLWLSLIVGLVVAAALFGRWWNRLAPITAPLSVSMLLLGISTLVFRQPNAPPTNATLWLAFGTLACALIVAAVAGSWLYRRAPGRAAQAPWRALATHSAMFLLLLGAAEALSARGEAAAPAAHADPPTSGDSRQINVILVVMDTVGAGHMSLYGYQRPTTPRLEALAKEATVYSNAISAGNMTLTSHASIFTGRYATRHGAVPPFGTLPPSFDTLAEVLARHGYRTASVVANYGYLDDSLGLAQGFELWTQRATALPVTARAAFYMRNIMVKTVRPVVRRVVPGTTRFPRGPQITREAFEKIELMKPTGKPFFMFLNYMDAHQPYEPLPPFDKMFGEPLPGVSTGSRLRAGVGVAATEENRRRLAAMYDGGVAAVDAEVGALVDRLKALGQYDSTLLIVTSDHGEAFGEAGEMGHNGLYIGQPVIHVPLIVKYPFDNVARREESFVSSVDIMPTILAAIGQPIPAGIQGVDLARPIPADRGVVSEGVPGDVGRVEFARAIIRGGQKLIVSNTAKPKLYDLSKDPAEQHDLYRQDHPGVEGLISLLTEQVGPGAPAAAHQATPDQETLERLRALGYVR